MKQLCWGKYVRPSLIYKCAAAAMGIVVLLNAIVGSQPALASKREPTKTPNFLVIVADDVGFSDLGFMGGEIRTPSLDGLADKGRILTNFYVSPNCSPTRSMFLSGTDNHQAGLGVMAEHIGDEVRGRPGYEGYLSERVYTLPARLKDHGYHTYITGKWHLGLKENTGPHKRGFEKSFVLLQGGGSHFNDRSGLGSALPEALYRDNGQLVEELPEDFFSSTFYTDKMIEYIESDKVDGQPFFAYLAFTAPHWPLHAPDDYIDRYAGRYNAGWDIMRERRLAGLKKTGVLPEDATSYPRLDKVPAWDSLPDYAQKNYARRMELYAAMIEHMDVQIGRVFEYLKSIDEYDNTFVLFFSDNGPEGNDAIDILDNNLWVPATFDNRQENLGRRGSYTWVGPGWAQVSAVPSRMYKSFPSEGGIRSPGIISYPGLPAGKTLDSNFISVMDIAPTLLELAGVSQSENNPRRADTLPIKGKSIVSYLMGESESVHPDDHETGWELFGRRALRKGDWKIVWLWKPYGTGDWQLYNLSKDPGEVHDLASLHPGKLKELITAWDHYVADNNVIVLEGDHGYGK